MENILSTLDKKVKFVFLGMVGLLFVSIVLLVAVSGSRQILKSEYESVKEELTNENNALKQKATAALDDKQAIENKLQSLQSDFDRINQERADLEKKYDLINKERQELVEKLKQRKTKEPTVAQPTAVTTDDSYWARILKEKAALEIQVDKLKEQLDSVRLSTEEYKSDKTTLELEVSNLSGERKELENKIAYHEEVANSLSSQLVREKKVKREIQAELQTLRREHAVMLRQIKTLNAQKASLETRLAKAQKDKSSLEENISNINEMLEYKLGEVVDLKRDLEEIHQGTDLGEAAKSSIELPPIVVRSTSGAESAYDTGKAVKVLAVNKENNFIIINLGEEDGIKPGANFNVYRDGKRIAAIEVIQTRKNVAACDIIHSSVSIEEGDRIQ